jgi:hypothetical protein
MMLCGKPSPAFSPSSASRARFEMKQRVYDGEIGFVAWSAETEDNVYDLGVDTFVVRDRKIVAQTYAAKVTPK